MAAFFLLPVLKLEVLSPLLNQCHYKHQKKKKKMKKLEVELWRDLPLKDLPLNVPLNTRLR